MNHLRCFQSEFSLEFVQTGYRTRYEIMMRPSDAFWGKAAKNEMPSVAFCSQRQAGGNLLEHPYLTAECRT